MSQPAVEIETRTRTPPSRYGDRSVRTPRSRWSSTRRTREGEVVAPPVKRVQVSNQMDILAELEGLRKQATMGAGGRWARAADQDVDIESLLAGSDPVRELRERVHETLNSDIFKNMRGVQVAVRIHNQDGETIHALDPVNVEVSRAGKLERLSLRFTIDLENKR